MKTPRNKPSLTRVILIAVAVVLFWRGAWGLMDLYVFPDHELISYIVSLAAGLVILFFTIRMRMHLTSGHDASTVRIYVS